MAVGYKWFRTRSVITRSAININLKVFAGKITSEESILSGNVSGKCRMLLVYVLFARFDLTVTLYNSRKMEQWNFDRQNDQT